VPGPWLRVEVYLELGGGDRRGVAVTRRWRDAVEATVRESTCRERASGLRNASKRLKINKETTHDLV
jgi:hypothetical protein